MKAETVIREKSRAPGSVIGGRHPRLLLLAVQEVVGGTPAQAKAWATDAFDRKRNCENAARGEYLPMSSGCLTALGGVCREQMLGTNWLLYTFKL